MTAARKVAGLKRFLHGLLELLHGVLEDVRYVSVPLWRPWRDF